MRTRAFLAVVAVLAGCEAAPEQAPGPRTVAIFLTSKNPADANTAVAITDTIESMARDVDELDVVTGESLRQRLGRDPNDAITGCGAQLTCISALAATAAVEAILFGRLGTTGDAIRIQFLGIEAGTEQIDRRLQLEVASLHELEPVLREKFEPLFGVSLPPGGPPIAPIPRAAERLPIGHCDSAVGPARIRPAETLQWEALADGRALYVGDIIETGESAMARVAYVSGKQLQIAPSSVVVMEPPDRADGNEQISIQAGTVRGIVEEGQGEIRIRAPDGDQLSLSPEAGSGKLAYRIGVRADKTLEVAVREGRGVVRSGVGQTATLAAGSARDVAQGQLVGEVVELPAFPGLVSPGVDATVRYREQLSLALKWKAISGAVAYHVQVAEDQSFQHLRIDEVSGAPRWIFEPPAAGTYYWRVATKGKGGRESEFGFSRRLYVTPGERGLDLLVAPADGAELEFPANQPRFISFTWRAAVPPAPYVLLVSEYEDVRHKPTVRITTKAQEVMTRQIPPGYYYWGVYLQRGGAFTPIFKVPRKLTVSQPAS